MADYPVRKNTRLKNYDYGTPGAYFITVCTHNKENILSEITYPYKKGIVGEGLCALPQTDTKEKTEHTDNTDEILGCLLNPCVILTEIGEVVRASIEFIGQQNQDISVDKYVIMPNHIHLLLSVTDGDRTGGHGDPPLQIYDIIGRMKSYTTKIYGKTLWQRSFHDRIIRNEKEYQEIYNYIEYNAWKWKEDCFYCG